MTAKELQVDISLRKKTRDAEFLLTVGNGPPVETGSRVEDIQVSAAVMHLSS